MDGFNLIKNPNSNKFDKDIIQQHSYNIIQDSAHLKNSVSNNKNNSIINKSNNYTSEFNNDNNNNDEDSNLKFNLNINNYLSKQNINSSKNSLSSSNKNNQKMKKNKNLKKKNNTGKNKNNVFQKLNKNNKNSYKNIYSNNALYQKESNEVLKSKLLARIKQQKEALNAYNLTSNINKKNNHNNNNNKKEEKLLLPKNNKKEENGKTKKERNEKIEKNEKNEKKEKNEKNELKEEPKNVPKILTFLRTFKNFAKPFKANNDSNETGNNNNNNPNKDNTSNENNLNLNINPNKSCFNFNPKIKPKIGKLNLNKRNKEINIEKLYIDQNNLGDGNEGDDFIDYNRFTFRNNIDEEENLPYKTFNEINNNNDLYKNNDKNKNNVNIQNNNGDNLKTLYRNNKFLGDDNNKEISPNFKQKKNPKKNIYKTMSKYYSNNNINDNQPYKRKNYLKNKYSSPKPLPRGKGKINYNYSCNNLPINNLNNLNIPSFDKYNNNNNDNEDSIQSLNSSMRYEKPKINDSFPKNINNSKNQIHNDYFYNINDISADQIRLSKNYNTSNRPLKNDKIHEIVININDSLESYNKENSFNTNNYFYSNKNPLKRKTINTSSANNNYIKGSPISAKQNGGVYNYSYNYDSSQFDEDEDSDKNKMNTNFSRFMEPFQRNNSKKWYNEDSYYSYDIMNMNKMAKNKNLLYQKPLKSSNSNKNILNKNNSMYIKRVVHYDGNIKNNNNIDVFSDNNNMNDSGISSNFKYQKDYTDFDERDNNIHDFDAPKAIKDSIDEDSSRENQLSVNSDIKTYKLNDSFSNNNCNSSRSNYNNNTNNTNNTNNINNNNNNNNINNNNNSLNINKNSPNPSIRNQQNKEKIVYMKKINTVYNFYQGTKKLFSKINDKVFKIHKKEQKKNDNVIETDININNDGNNDKNKINDVIVCEGISTPRKPSDKEENMPYNNILKEEKEEKEQKDNRYINIYSKIINDKKLFIKKYYNYYLPKINKNINGFYIYKNKPNSVYKIPIKLQYYMTKEIKTIYKIPSINNCYFHKLYVINNNTFNLEHQQFFSFFSIGDHYNPNNHSNTESLLKDNNNSNSNSNNNKISNLKQNININNNIKQFSILSNNVNSLDYNNIERESFSFKNNKAIVDSSDNNKNKNEFIEMNILNFSLGPKNDKKDVNKFDIEKMQQEKNNDLILIKKVTIIN